MVLSRDTASPTQAGYFYGYFTGYSAGRRGSGRDAGVTRAPAAP
jgi:hypothetical protein